MADGMTPFRLESRILLREQAFVHFPKVIPATTKEFHGVSAKAVRLRPHVSKLPPVHGNKALVAASAPRY